MAPCPFSAGREIGLLPAPRSLSLGMENTTFLLHHLSSLSQCSLQPCCFLLPFHFFGLFISFPIFLFMLHTLIFT